MQKLPGWVWGLAIAGLILLAGWLGYQSQRPGGDADSRVAQTQAPVEVTTDTSPVSPRRPELSWPTPDIEVDAADAELFYRSWDADMSDPDSPAACLEFSSATDPSRVIEDKAFIRVEPEAPFSLDVRGRRLCVLGLDADKSYNVRVLPGLTALNGRTMEQSAAVPITFAPKPPLVGFVGDGIFLPRGDRATLGIKAMNADAVKLTVYRVNHRALFDQTPNDGETTVEGDWSYNGEAWQTRVEVHEERIETAGDVNQMVEVGFDLTDIVEAAGPGAYIVDVTRDAEENRAANSWRWLYVTDMALASYRSDDALHVTVRSIASAKTLPEVKLALIARNNEVLAEAQSDRDGRAVFPGAALAGSGNQLPKMVMAYAGGDDFAALDLSRSPLDLSAFDVAGRNAPGDVEAFLYTDRGIYRPGETVRLTALVRDRAGEAAFDRDGTLVVTKPDGSEFIEQRVSPSDMAGALYRAVDIPRDAPRGRWTATLSLDGLDTPVGSLKFAVEDFVPEQLRLAIRSDEAPVVPGDPRPVQVVADFLYGAKGRGLDAEAEARIQIDPKPFPDFSSYQFGNAVEPYREQIVSAGQGVTTVEGVFDASLDLAGDAYAYAAPLRALVTAGVAEPGGRYVRDSLLLSVRSEAVYVGFDPEFDGGYARRNTPADIDIVALSREGERVAAEATLRLIEEDYDYHWFRENGRWRYRRDRRDQVIRTETITIPADRPYRFSRALEYGQYRVEVEQGGQTASLQFGSGWRRPAAGSDAPDRIEMGLDAADYSPGDTLALTLDAPFAGEAELVVADGDIRRIQSVTLDEGSQTIRLRSDADWTGDLHVMLTLYGPLTDQAPRRAVGLVHVPRDRAGQVLDVSIDAPATIRPRRSQDVTVKLASYSGEAFVTLAAVDTGILQITDFTPPDPVAMLFGKRAFALDVFDDYSRMLEPFNGPDRVGGDVLGGSGLSVVPTKTVALWQGPVEMRNGRATIALDIPDFQGELTLMVVAWSEDRIGSASTPMVVRDPVTAQLALPRFLAPGDTAVATLALDNVDGRDGDYGSVLSLDGSRLADATTTLAKGARAEERFDITATDVGVQTFGLETRGPGFDVQRDYRIEIRSPALPRTQSQIVQVAAGESTILPIADATADFLPLSVDVSLSASFTPGLDPAPLLASLSRYPYGCTEQTVSVAQPLLLSEGVGRLPGLTDMERERELQGAIDKLLARQDADGAFGLWSQGDRQASPYLQLYTSEFMLDAAKAGYTVPDSAVERTLKAVTSLAKLDGPSRLSLDYQYGLSDTNPDYELRRAERAAYALAILARHDRVKKTEAVYLSNRFAKRMDDSVALSQLGYALKAIGEDERAEAAFDRALSTVERDSERNYYNTPVRNAAALLALSGDYASETSDYLPRDAVGYLNTHEKAWLLRAVASGGEATDDRPFADTPAWSPAARGARMSVPPNASTLTIANPHDRPVWLTLSVTGQPREMDAATSNGATLAKTVYTLDGREMEGMQIAKGERAVILLDARARGSNPAMWVLADLLPAGFEIETVLGEADAGEAGPFSWLGELTDVDVTESRDDRFIASWRTGEEGRYDMRPNRRVAYVVRAVTEGDFAFPGAHMEDMYRPARNASTEGGRLQITRGGEF